MQDILCLDSAAAATREQIELQTLSMIGGAIWVSLMTFHWINERINEWMNEWLSLNEWMNHDLSLSDEWMNDWMNDDLLPNE